MLLIGMRRRIRFHALNSFASHGYRILTRSHCAKETAATLNTQLCIFCFSQTEGRENERCDVLTKTRAYFPVILYELNRRYWAVCVLYSRPNSIAIANEWWVRDILFFCYSSEYGRRCYSHQVTQMIVNNTSHSHSYILANENDQSHSLRVIPHSTMLKYTRVPEVVLSRI